MLKPLLRGGLISVLLAHALSASTLSISGPALTLTFDTADHRLRLTQMQKRGESPLLYSDKLLSREGAGSIGNPFALVIRKGPHAGVFQPDSFHVLALHSSSTSLLAYLQHDQLPLQLALTIDVEGSVATWRGQVFWNGDDPVELDIYFPLLSRVKFQDPATDRLLAAEVSGLVKNGLGSLNFSDSYIGSMSAPLILAEGGGRGLAVLDDNRAEYAADPGACALRGMVAGNRFPVSEMPWTDHPLPQGGNDGPLIGVRYTRVFRPVSYFGGQSAWAEAEKIRDAPPVQKLGDAVDIGPVRTYAYTGSWKHGALWLRQQRRDLPFRSSPAHWYRGTTFVSEDMGDNMVKADQTFYDYPKILAGKQRMGSDLFTIPGFNMAEILGSSANFLNRGDYLLAAPNLGGLEAERAGINALHRQNGHILYYVEGLIVWKRSRIGRTSAKEWAIMNEDGSYSETYKGFYDMCPAVPAWQEWFGKTLAELVRTTGVDGFFIDSLTATNYHRCYNPAHHHPHPDVWTWGVRQFLGRVRAEVDQAGPDTILFTEGEADIAREFTDGFITHTAFWNHGLFTEPLTRFIYPQMRAFESWGYSEDPQRFHVFNAVNGEYIYAHNSRVEQMTPLSLETRHYYDAYPELTEAQMAEADIQCDRCLGAIFQGSVPVISVGNATPSVVDATVRIPIAGTILFDRVRGAGIPVVDGKAVLRLAPWQVQAFELRP